MITQTETVQIIECENNTRQDEDRVFCNRANDWVSIKTCTRCGSEARQWATQEW